MNTLAYVTGVVRSVANQRQQIAVDEDTDILRHAELDSLAMLEIMGTLEKHYRMTLFEGVDLQAISTPRKLAEFIDRTCGGQPA